MANDKESTERFSNPKSELGVHIGNCRLDHETKETLIMIARHLDRLSTTIEKIDRRLNEQERWTATQQGVIYKIGWIIGVAVIGGLGTILVWAYDAARGKA
jgi:hypothetical protein